MRWEYKVLTLATEGRLNVKVDDDRVTFALNGLGREAWEVVSTTDVTVNGYTTHLVFTLKRPLTRDAGSGPPHPLADVQP